MRRKYIELLPFYISIAVLMLYIFVTSNMLITSNVLNKDALFRAVEAGQCGNYVLPELSSDRDYSLEYERVVELGLCRGGFSK